MFGYIRPFREELKVRDLERYQALYCGLCHTMGQRYGLVSRFFLDYDFTFLAMVLTTAEEVPTLRRRRCPACPLRGRPTCETGESLALAADESVILTWWKLRDNVEDHGFWGGLPARLLSLALRPAYRKAARHRPDFAAAVRDCLVELRHLEEARSPSLDRTADTFARILQAAAPSTGDAAENRARGQLLYHVGRWIYLTDAWDDLEEDACAGRYNPISARFEGIEEEQARQAMRATLRHSLNLAASAGNLMPLGVYTPVVENILYLGLPMVEELVFTGRWREARKQMKRSIDGRTII